MILTSKYLKKKEATFTIAPFVYDQIRSPESVRSQ